jgi:hypothetical protein
MPLVLFCFSYFSHGVWNFCPGSGLDCDRLTYASHVAQMTITHHHVWLNGWDGVSLTFCSSWPQNGSLPISTSWVTGITATTTLNPEEFLSYLPSIRGSGQVELNPRLLTIPLLSPLSCKLLEGRDFSMSPLQGWALSWHTRWTF